MMAAGSPLGVDARLALGKLVVTAMDSVVGPGKLVGAATVTVVVVAGDTPVGRVIGLSRRVPGRVDLGWS